MTTASKSLIALIVIALVAGGAFFLIQSGPGDVAPDPVTEPGNAHA